MGAWGVGIFSDDVAETVRFHYKDLIGDGFTGKQATQILIEEFGKEMDTEDTLVFWLSLAAIQWKLGRLQDEVKTKAIEIIVSGVELERWKDDPKLKKKRQEVLNKLKEQLNSPQPSPKKVPKRFVEKTNLKIGDAISYRLLSGKYIILKVVEIAEEWTGDTHPIFVICDWVGETIPTKNEIDDLPLLEWTWVNGKKELKELSILRAGKKDNPEKRIQLIAEGVRIDKHQTEKASKTLIYWKEFDKILKQYYNIS
ncbi:hypothetical protein JIR001_14500 [Polycladomyces abyssicola]|uniref:DUF4259 domain-containing protein n=1 Tax=Polycladomyces abyssicola TaxID=1125966 RepID=A0A8D5UGQ4_9BACL|nr:hypothetical protein [Polycladomyces abyssicola]BCU81667.1 hypothetical protein JIR001_14500 [Polycladomyces abyssicola]